MSLLSLAESYIAIHCKNIGTDVVQHLKAFAVHAESLISDVDTDVKEEVNVMVSDTEHEATAVESAVKELEAHAEGSFAKLLAAESTPTTESK